MPAHHTVPFGLMAELHNVQGYSSSIPGTASARSIFDWAGRYVEVDETVVVVADSCVDAMRVYAWAIATSRYLRQ